MKNRILSNYNGLSLALAGIKKITPKRTGNFLSANLGISVAHVKAFDIGKNTHANIYCVPGLRGFLVQFVDEDKSLESEKKV